MRAALLLITILTGCSAGNQSFSAGNDNTAPPEANGLLQVTPADGVNFGSMSITSLGKPGYFGIFNIGTSNLEVTHVKITDAGDNVGQEVFTDLIRHDGGTATSYSLGAGDKVEYKLVAQNNQVSEAIGNIEVYTSDSNFDDGGPGKFQLPLYASFVDPDHDQGSDTGSEDGDTGVDDTDTGTDSSDTGETTSDE